VALTSKGYQLSDSESKPGKYTLPGKIVEPGEFVVVYSDNYIGRETLHQMSMPFGLKQGENIYLSFENRLLETISVIDLHDGCICRRNLTDGKFYETKADSSAIPNP
jgi:hypothetical protein